jgi:hypothetical protein
MEAIPDAYNNVSIDTSFLTSTMHRQASKLRYIAAYTSIDVSMYINILQHIDTPLYISTLLNV